LPVAQERKPDLVDAIGEFFYDALGFVYFAFPWGKKGTILENEDGPDDWQVDILNDLSEGTLTVKEAIQIAVRSGHTIGKTALISWIILWFISTRPHPQVVVTANTETQLNTKTWRELSKWHNISINKHWFTWTATKFYHNAHPETWFAAAIPWSIARAQAFAGAHDKYVLIIFDEASEIADIIWETAEGSVNTEGAIWVVFGNPTKGTGRFCECFGKYRHRWITREIDSRDSKRANRVQIAKWIEDYGEDSDFVRIRVKGMPPRRATNQFISLETVEKCQRYKAEGFESFAKILGVEVARFGDDKSVIRLRQGRKVFPGRKFHGLDTMQYADKVVESINEHDPDYVFVDGGGVGGGVIDRLKQLGHKDLVIEVNFGSKAMDEKKYANKRAEMWDYMKQYLEAGAEIDDDKELRDDLVGPEYGYNAKQQLQLEKKEDMKDRGIASPDDADAIALTFAQGFTLPVKKKAKIPQNINFRF